MFYVSFVITLSASHVLWVLVYKLFYVSFVIILSASHVLRVFCDNTISVSCFVGFSL